MKQIIQIALVLVTSLAYGQYDGNTSPDYPTLIKIYQELASNNDEIELYEMGESDYGLPIYLCVINGAGDSLSTFQKAQQSTTLLVNNAIHPGEPDGVNACLIWISDWIKNGKKTKGLPVIGIIPAYNVGGMMNRSGTSRANQNGPEEYGFRGNSQNLDLNRDFIKMDTKNMFTFAKIYQALDPDVFLDAHVSNGADYQYVMSYIASVRERMSPALGELMHGEMIPWLEKTSAKRGFDLIPYVHTKGETPESGIQVFNDLPRYAMGYASLMNSISFTLETHMLKPFPERVQATLVFIDATIEWMGENADEIEEARAKTKEWVSSMDQHYYNYRLTDSQDSILFKGFESSKPVSEITGLARLKYHQDRPYEKYIPYFNVYEPEDWVSVPDYFIVGGQCTDVIERLMANGIEMREMSVDSTITTNCFRIISFENGTKPYEGHYLHNKIKREVVQKKVLVKKGDFWISTHQNNRRFLMSVLDPASPDSYFAWNFFDSYVQQKEYFSPYVFEEKAVEILANDSDLRKEFEERKANDSEFNESPWDQLFFIYQHSEFYEPTHNFLPIYFGDIH
ncbi:MAG: hypothetical protein QNK23_13515 [Crocinitomicaceae bacterium]|nr:hypothetical protein [Crocinitomicaceae bacterium]